MSQRTRNVVSNSLTVAILLLLLFLLGILVWPARGSTSQITGTLKDSFGNGINGTLVLSLPVPATDTTTGASVTPTPITCRIINGAVSNCPPVFDVANLQPQNLYYSARVYDMSGTLVFNGNYPITGASYNLFSAVPTTVTTSNVSYINPATTTTSNTFCCTQNFQGQISSTLATGTPPFSITSTTLVPNLNVQNLNGCVVSGTPSANQVLQASSPTVCGWQTANLNGFKLECVNVTPVTVANTALNTPLQTCTIPANDIGSAQTFYVDVQGVGSSVSTPTLVIGLYLDSVLIAQTTPLTGGRNWITTLWTCRAFFTGITTGATGTVSPALQTWFDTGTGTTTPSATPNAPITINTTISHTLQFQAQWGVGSASNTVTSSTFTVHRVG